MLAEASQFYGYQAFTATVPEAEETLQRLGRAAIQLVIANTHLTSDPQTHEGYVLARRWHVQ